MAKLQGLFKYNGTFQGVTAVNSRAYGKHIRKARTKFTLSEGMKKSSAGLAQANVYAKAFKDAIDPYRRDSRDNMMWQRLVSLFKKQIREKGGADFSVLEQQELNKRYPLGRLLSVNVSAARVNNTLEVHANSRYTQRNKDNRADGYQQTMIVMFADNDLRTETLSESAIISLNADAGQQDMRCIIPGAATVAIIVVKCNLSLNGEALHLQVGMGTRVEKVVKLDQTEV